MSNDVLSFFHVPNIEQLGAKCALVLLCGGTSPNVGHVEAVTIVARADGSTTSRVEYVELIDPPYKQAAEAAVKKAKGKALTLLSMDGALSNKLSALESEWRETTETVICKELQRVSDEIGGLLGRVRSEMLKQVLNKAKAAQP